jgi:hypothetical protein
MYYLFSIKVLYGFFIKKKKKKKNEKGNKFEKFVYVWIIEKLFADRIRMRA